MMNKITGYFGISMQRVPTDDWDEAEAMLTRVLKSRAAAADFKPELARGSSGSMNS